MEADTDKEKDEGRSWARGADVMTTGRVVGVSADLLTNEKPAFLVTANQSPVFR